MGTGSYEPFSAYCNEGIVTYTTTKVKKKDRIAYIEKRIKELEDITSTQSAFISGICTFILAGIAVAVFISLN